MMTSAIIRARADRSSSRLFDLLLSVGVSLLELQVIESGYLILGAEFDILFNLVHV